MQRMLSRTWVEIYCCILAIMSTLSGLLQPLLELLQGTESMRDLVLLDFVHLGVAIEVSFWLGV